MPLRLEGVNTGKSLALSLSIFSGKQAMALVKGLNRSQGRGREDGSGEGDNI